VSAVIVPPVSSIAANIRSAIPVMTAFCIALRCQVGEAIHTMSDLVERRFVQFADVPYVSPVSRQQWEKLWEMEEKR
jgi:hypothetical protein